MKIPSVLSSLLML
ncbi:hypothetical protein cypCar_00050066 [Cyprinus carpio]|nr:hypothetical protein cypCar_00050066 [Cyprinus carpio]